MTIVTKELKLNEESAEGHNGVSQHSSLHTDIVVKLKYIEPITKCLTFCLFHSLD